VHWPSGQVDQFIDVAANQAIRIVEGQAALQLTVVPIPSVSVEVP